jgi:hypothetical protein
MARRVGNGVTLVVLGLSGLYLLVYLYRWEWNRALVAGVFFIAAEVAAVGTNVQRRLRGIEARLDESASTERTAAHDQRALRIHEAAPDPANRFAWLDDSMRSTNVFVPVLLGAGVILSLLATAVERLASATATPQLERRLAHRLELLALPSGGLLGPPGPAPLAVDTHVRVARRAFVVAAAAVGILGLTQLVDIVADATQTRTDQTLRGATELTLSVHVEGRSAGHDATAEALWVACRNTVNRAVEATPLTKIGPDIYRFVVSPALGDHARRRLEGCLEDATLDRTSAHVVALVDVRK